MVLDRREKQGQLVHGGFFQMRQGVRNFHLDAMGYWAYPALRVGFSGKVHWVHLLFPVSKTASGKSMVIFRLKTVVVTEANDTVVVSYHDFSRDKDPFIDQDWQSPVGKYPHPALYNLQYEKLIQLEGSLLALYPQAAEQFLHDGSLPDLFIGLYKQLSHPVAFKYLGHFCADFSSMLVRKS